MVAREVTGGGGDPLQGQDRGEQQDHHRYGQGNGRQAGVREGRDAHRHPDDRTGCKDSPEREGYVPPEMSAQGTADHQVEHEEDLHGFRRLEDQEEERNGQQREREADGALNRSREHGDETQLKPLHRPDDAYGPLASCRCAQPSMSS